SHPSFGMCSQGRTVDRVMIEASKVLGECAPVSGEAAQNEPKIEPKDLELDALFEKAVDLMPLRRAPLWLDGFVEERRHRESRMRAEIFTDRSRAEPALKKEKRRADGARGEDHAMRRARFEAFSAQKHPANTVGAA